MRLEGVHLSLRPPTIHDAEQILRWENATEVVTVSSHEGGLRLEDVRSYITGIMDVYMDKQLRWIISVSNRDIGTLDIFDVDFKTGIAHVGILIAEKSDRRAGRGKEAMNLLVDYCRDILELSTLIADVQLENLGSLRFFEEVGFEQEEMERKLLRYQLKLRKA